jgi:hypothetical protein
MKRFTTMTSVQRSAAAIPAIVAGALLCACGGQGAAEAIQQLSSKHTVGGMVSGLQGSGLVLEDNGGDDLTVAGNSSFTFAATLATGASYSVTVKTQPGNPAQTCTVSNSSGTIGSANVSGVAVDCDAPSIFQVQANPLHVTPQLDIKHSVSVLISAANGGTVSATGADGAVFTLQIPAAVLRSDEVITMTPIAAISDIPLSNGFVSGVTLEPQGLRLFAPATLTIQAPGNVPVASQWGFSFDGAGDDFHAYPMLLQQAPAMQIAHFTGFGYGAAPSLGATLEATVALLAEHRLEQKAAELVNAERQIEVFGGQPDPQFMSNMSALYQHFYTDVVQPLLDAATKDDTFLETAVDLAAAWVNQVQVLGFGKDTRFAGEVSAVLTAFKQLIVKSYDDAFFRCTAPDGVPSAELVNMIGAKRMYELLVGNSNAQFPQFDTQLAACAAGALLQLTLDSTMGVSLTDALIGTLITTNSDVSATKVPLQLDAKSLQYTGSGALAYNSFTGAVHWIPPAFDCGSTFTGNPGTLSVLGTIDLNINALSIKKPSDVRVALSISPDVTESVTIAGTGPHTPCVALTIPYTGYTTGYLGIHMPQGGGGSSAGRGLPYSVNVDVQGSFSLSGVPEGGQGTATEATTITLNSVPRGT